MRHEDVRDVAVHGPAVGVAAGLAEDGDRQPQVGAVDQALRGGHLHAQVRPAGIAHRGDAEIEGPLQIPLGRIELVGERLLRQLERIRPGHGGVDVAVDEPRQDRVAGEVVGLIGGNVGLPAVAQHIGDHPVRDHQIRRDRIAPGAVEDPCPGQQHAHGSRPCRSSTPSLVDTVAGRSPSLAHTVVRKSCRTAAPHRSDSTLMFSSTPCTPSPWSPSGAGPCGAKP